MPPSVPRSEFPAEPRHSPTLSPQHQRILRSPAPRSYPHLVHPRPSYQPSPGRSLCPPPPPTFLSFSHLASAKVSVAHRFADHLHKFHENDHGAAAGDLWQ